MQKAGMEKRIFGERFIGHSILTRPNHILLLRISMPAPHDSHVSKDFNPIEWSSSSLAELGYIVVRIDGMGTNNRSKKFHDVCWKNLKDAGFPDRIKWIQAAARKYKYMDTSRGRHLWLVSRRTERDGGTVVPQ